MRRITTIHSTDWDFVVETMGTYTGFDYIVQVSRNLDASTGLGWNVVIFKENK